VSTDLSEISGSHDVCPDDGGGMHLWNIGLLQRDYKALCTRSLSSYLPIWWKALTLIGHETYDFCCCSTILFYVTQVFLFQMYLLCHCFISDPHFSTWKYIWCHRYKNEQEYWIQRCYYRKIY
jgi:hypothetical protein